MGWNTWFENTVSRLQAFLWSLFSHSTYVDTCINQGTVCYWGFRSELDIGCLWKDQTVWTEALGSSNRREKTRLTSRAGRSHTLRQLYTLHNDKCSEVWVVLKWLWKKGESSFTPDNSWLHVGIRMGVFTRREGLPEGPSWVLVL